jgi:hypothetical protein
MPDRMQSLLRGAPRDELHTPGNDVGARVFNQKVNVVGCNYVIEGAETKAFLCLRVPVLNVLNGSLKFCPAVSD